jgi:DNA sulfur modification protein DndE
MPTLKVQRVKFSAEADGRLRMLKARTGLTPNIICRLGLCLSLDEPGLPRSDSSEPSQREINRYTLLGEYDLLFVTLLSVRHAEAADDPEELARLFVEHLHRGITLLANRLKAPASIAELAQGTSA